MERGPWDCKRQRARPGLTAVEQRCWEGAAVAALCLATESVTVELVERRVSCIPADELQSREASRMQRPLTALKSAWHMLQWKLVQVCQYYLQ